MEVQTEILLLIQHLVLRVSKNLCLMTLLYLSYKVYYKVIMALYLHMGKQEQAKLIPCKVANNDKISRGLYLDQYTIFLMLFKEQLILKNI